MELERRGFLSWRFEIGVYFVFLRVFSESGVELGFFFFVIYRKKIYI